MLDPSNVPSCLSRNDLLGSGPPEPPGSPTGVDRDLSAKLGAGSRPRSCNRSRAGDRIPTDCRHLIPTHPGPRATPSPVPNLEGRLRRGRVDPREQRADPDARDVPSTDHTLFSHKRTGAASAATSLKSPKQYARRNQTASLTQGQFSAGAYPVSVILVKPDFRSHCSTEQGKADPELATRRHKAH